MTEPRVYEVNRELKKLRRLENLTLWGIIGVAFLSPLLIQQNILPSWTILLPFFIGLLIHHYIYVPLFLLRANYFTYFFLLFILLLGIVFSCEAVIDILDEKFGIKWTNLMPYESTLLSNFVVAMLLMGMNVAIRIVFNNVKEKMLAHEADNKLMNYKMEFLQFQISPHFLMNTLNNIHVLVDTDEKKAKDAIVSLSRLLRHMLYESTPGAKVSLERQLAVFRAYCNLNLLRYGENVKLSITVQRDIPNVQLPPLIMIVFIENAFKHGIVYGEENHIDMNFWVEPGFFHFSISNTVFPDKPKSAKPGGLGIKNVKERLNLLYGDSYKLTMEQTQSEYIVHLQLPL
ncbi:MAG: histidine kinase [Bacteroidales bacterium]|jgi:sensor histidine kinase YesM|nr:histidine kinase [Bacteroidales bacterium]NLH24485.1 histidine kinase [Bacteroidales bacterium]